MKFVEDNVEYITQEPGVEGMYKMMELAARQCYLTNDLIKEGSAHKIIDNIIIPSGHTSILEFGTVYLIIPDDLYETRYKYEDDRYTRIEYANGNCYITTTYRTILQGDYEDPIEAIKNNFDKDWKYDLKYWSEPTEYHHKRYCIRFTMDRVGSQSVERHRGNWGISYAQESTRYVNYHRDKFGGDILIALPSKFYSLIDEWSRLTDVEGNDASWIKDATIDEQLEFLRHNDNGWCIYEHSLKTSEQDYMTLVGDYGWKPEDARGVLNLDIKTQFMMCAYPEDWKMWFFRRVEKHAHAHIQSIANKALKIFSDMKVIIPIV